MQVVNVLSHAIATGQYRAGDQLPTEAELCAAYDLSPMTVRRAIGVLLDRGAVSTTRGRGTFVKPLQLALATFELGGFRDLLSDPRVEARVLEARIVPAGARAAANLDVPEGTRVISIRRLLERGDEPLFYHRESLVYDPTTPTVESELGVTALRDLFEGGVGAGPKHGELIIHASVLTEEEARHVDRPAGGAALVLEHLFYDYDDTPMSWGRFVCRGDLLQFHAHIGVQATAPAGKPAKKGRS
jgi:GntR family transcriptional regulator